MIPESAATSSSRLFAQSTSRNDQLLDKNSAKRSANVFLSPEDSSAILASIEPPSLSVFSKMPNITLDQDLVSHLQDEEVDLNLPDVALSHSSDEFGAGDNSFLLIDGKEHLKVCHCTFFISHISTRIQRLKNCDLGLTYHAWAG
jgi:hypothetical protein